MSETMKQLKVDHLDARKKKDAVATSLLGTLISEAANVGKTKENRESTEEEVQSTIRKFVKNANETRSALQSRGGDTADVDAEIAILQHYQPRMMSEDEIRTAIIAIRGTKPDATLGDIMGALKAKFSGTYNGKIANAIAREQLAA